MDELRKVVEEMKAERESRNALSQAFDKLNQQRIVPSDKVEATPDVIE